MDVVCGCRGFHYGVWMLLWVLVIQLAGLIDRCTECLIAHTLCSESATAREATVFILTMRYMRFPHTNVQRYISLLKH